MSSGKASRWVALQDKCKHIGKQVEELEAEFEEVSNERNKAAEDLKETVGANISRRVISIDDGRVVIVERQRAPKRKHKVGTEPPPDQYTVTLSVVEVEKDYAG